MVAIIGGGTNYAFAREHLRGTDVKQLYEQVNRDSFHGELPPATVTWGYLPDAYGETTFYTDDTASIEIDRASVTSGKMLRETMEHEMCHVATRVVVQETGQDVHGAAWTDCMRRFD
jgi:predicted SprT family Zn-dependent metalloprotease